MEFSLEHMTADPGADLLRVRLQERFGAPIEPQRLEPLDELVRTILSQNTNDQNSDAAYRALQDRFQDWEKVININSFGPRSILAFKALMWKMPYGRYMSLSTKIVITGERCVA
jgi:endonuclease III